MNEMIIYYFLFVLSVTLVKSQPNLVFEMEIVSNSSIGVIEPLVYKLTLKNQSDSSQIIQMPWNTAYKPSLEFKRKGKSNWKEIKKSEWRSDYLFSMRWTPTPPLRMVEIKANQIFLSEEFVLSPVVGEDTSKNYIFAKEGIYQLRSVYYPQGPEGGNPVISNVVTVTVVPYKGVDKQAYKYLAGSPIPHIVYVYLITKGYGFSNIDPDPLIYCREIIDKFPSSQFSPWAKYYVARRESAKNSVPGEKELLLIKTLISQAYQETSDERLKKLIIEFQNILRLEN
jgi:hypothetical protein